ncbi:hypothetical protein Dimus_014501 [Dionaea muscipula]
MSSLLPDLTIKIYPEPCGRNAIPRAIQSSGYPHQDDTPFLDHSQDDDDDEILLHDHFDRLPDSLLLLIFNKIGDIKTLGCCCLVSRRFHSLVAQVENAVIRVDCIISDDDSSSSSSSSAADKSRSAFLSLFRSLFKRFQSLTQILGTKRSLFGPGSSLSFSFLSVGIGGGDHNEDPEQGCVTHHSPTQVLKNFNEIRFLRIELPGAELGVDDGVLLKWRADFGSTLDSCVILGADRMSSSIQVTGDANPPLNAGDDIDNGGSIPESLYTNGGLKLRVVWTISSLIAAAGRHYLLQPIIAEHWSLDRVVLTDAHGQGMLCMNRGQLEELRVKPLSASSASRRTQVPALSLRLWYAPQLELPGGVILKGATLVAIRPSELSASTNQLEDIKSDLSWISSAFEEPYGTAAKMLVKGRTYSLEMNSF